MLLMVRSSIYLMATGFLFILSAKENIQVAVLYFCFIVLITLLDIFLLILPAVSIFVLSFLVLDPLFLILCLVHLFNGT